MNYSFASYISRDKILFKLGLKRIVFFLNAIKTRYNETKNQKKAERFLEIGPGLNRIPNFETLNIIDGKNVDYIMDISAPMHFRDNSFDLIYASHVIEHVPWFLQKNLFLELYRILKPEGKLEIWVPNFSKIIKIMNDFEQYGENNTKLDGWYRFNDEKDVCMWANGRIFTYGDGSVNPKSFNWHRCVYSESFLKKLFKDAGFIDISQMHNNEVRGYDHGWISLGIKGVKKQ